MKLEAVDIELLETYWRGELEGAACRALEERLLKDEAFKEAATELEQLQKGLRELQLRHWRSQLTQIEQEAPPMVLTKPTWWRRYGWIVLAGVLLLALLFIYVRNLPTPSKIKPAAVIAMEASEHESYIGSTLSADSGDAVRLYEEERDYQRAEPALQALFKESKDSTDLFFAALAAVRSNQGKKAIPILEALRNSNEYATIRENVEWNLALAYLEVEALDKGRKLLQRIEANGGRWAPNAKSVLYKLSQKKLGQ